MRVGRRPVLAPGRRLFVAIPVPAAVRDTVIALVDRVRAQADPAVRDVRWVRLDGLHLTLRFLGPTEEDRLASVADAVDRVAPSISPFDIVIAGAGAFPSEARPRTLWLGVEAGGDELTSAAGNLDAALAPSGWVPEDRPFRAHLTLARSDGVHSGPTVARRLIEAARDVREPFRATSIVLFESISGDGPARYEPLHEAPLG